MKGTLRVEEASNFSLLAMRMKRLRSEYLTKQPVQLQSEEREITGLHHAERSLYHCNQRLKVSVRRTCYLQNV
jgi:hypothetical protein